MPGRATRSKRVYRKRFFLLLCPRGRSPILTNNERTPQLRNTRTAPEPKLGLLRAVLNAADVALQVPTDHSAPAINVADQEPVGLFLELEELLLVERVSVNFLPTAAQAMPNQVVLGYGIWRVMATPQGQKSYRVEHSFVGGGGESPGFVLDRVGLGAATATAAGRRHLAVIVQSHRRCCRTTPSGGQ